MCGIAGMVRFGGTPVSRGVVGDMCGTLRHRGPDGDGFRFFGSAALGHRRLAIIDPSGGAQPIGNEDGSVWVTFNGEIYNYRDLRVELRGRGHSIRTESDSEVLVHAYEEWGESMLARLRGMFALGLWDERRRRLLLARDRLGIKPLFYCRLPAGLAFASELQAFRSLEAWTPSIDLEALDLYLHFQYIPAPFSIFKEARKLPPAHYLVVSADGSVEGPVRYWDLEFRPRRGVREAEWVERLDAAVSDAVRAHLVSDVPFGAFLSGGVDSSTVVAYMARHLQQPVRTFSIAFEDPRHDESRHARRVSEHVGTEHREEMVRPDAFGLLPELVRHYGEPFADSSALPTYYVSRLASRHVKMVLSGDGGDENFAGYATYQNILWEHRPPRGRVARARFAAGSVARVLGLRPALPRPEDTWFESVAYFGSGLRNRLWRPEYRVSAEASRRWFGRCMDRAPAADVCSRFQYVDFQTYLPNDILTKVDVASMCHGLEVRVPLLDHELVELVAEIPWDLKLHAEADASDAEWPARTTKYLLKKVAERCLPREVLHRPKQGFSIPLGEWIRGLDREDLWNRLRGPVTEWFDPATTAQLIDEHHSGADHGPRLWALLVLAEWLTQAREGE